MKATLQMHHQNKSFHPPLTKQWMSYILWRRGKVSRRATETSEKSPSLCWKSCRVLGRWIAYITSAWNCNSETWVRIISLICCCFVCVRDDLPEESAETDCLCVVIMLSVFGSLLWNWYCWEGQNNYWETFLWYENQVANIIFCVLSALLTSTLTHSHAPSSCNLLLQLWTAQTEASTR